MNVIEETPHRMPPRWREASERIVWLSLALALGIPALASAQDQEPGPGSVDVEVRVLDSGSLAAVEAAEVRLAGTGHRGLTGPDGRLTLPGVARGTHTLVLEHLAYGEHRQEVTVEGDGLLRFDIRLSRQALLLAPLLVAGRRSEEWSRDGRGTSVRLIPRDVIEQFEGSGLSLADVIRARLPGLSIYQSGGMANQAACVESRRTSSLLRANECLQARVLLDRVPVSQPSSVLAGMPLHHVESVEYLSPGEAGVRYGSRAGYGVILITSRRPDAPSGERYGGWNYPVYDWGQEAGDHPWMATVAGAVLGNALGLAASRPGRGCVVMEIGPDALCGQSPTTAQGIAGFAFPVLGASLGAQLMGRTDQSVGRLRTTLLVSAAAMAVSYTVTTASNQHPITTGQRIGHGMVLIGVPLSAGLANRHFRSSREPDRSDLDSR